MYKAHKYNNLWTCYKLINTYIRVYAQKVLPTGVSDQKSSETIYNY